MWVDLPQLRKPSWRLFSGQQRYGRQLDWGIVELNSRCDCMSACGRCPLLGGWARLYKCAVLSFGFTIKELKHTPNNKVMVRRRDHHCYHPCHPVWALWRVSLLSIPPAGQFLCPWPHSKREELKMALLDHIHRASLLLLKTSKWVFS